MIKKVIIFLLISLSIKCQITTELSNHYKERIGNIDFDANLDKVNFQLCGDYFFQYFHLKDKVRYKGDKIAIETEFKKKYKPLKNNKESGLIRVRFIVNCKGETDRFRIISTDENYNENFFDRRITNQLVEISKSLKGWKPIKNDKEGYNYYQYLIFKIQSGAIIEILP